jgi:hypothetical protein
MTDNASATRKTSPIVKAIRELLGIMFWSLAVIKLFVFDLDIFLVGKYLPSYTWIVDYKFFFLFGGIAFLWLIVPNKIFRGSVAYVLGYPLVILFYHLPKLFFKNWTLAFLFLPSLVATFKSFKLRFISTMFGLIACLLILLKVGTALMILAMALLFVYLAIHYARQFRSAFSTKSFFNDIGRGIQAVWNALRDSMVIKELEAAKNFDQTTDAYKAKRSSVLQNLFLANWLFLYASFRLKRIQDSRILDVYLIGSLVYTFLVTVIVFAFEYFALYQLQPTSFAGSSDSSFFFFLYASFNTLLTVGFGDFSPIGVIARILTSLELFAWILIFLILFFTITTIIRERYHKDVDALVIQLTSEHAAIESLILQEYKLSLQDVETQVAKDSPGIVKFVSYLKVSE